MFSFGSEWADDDVSAIVDDETRGGTNKKAKDGDQFMRGRPVTCSPLEFFGRELSWHVLSSSCKARDQSREDDPGGGSASIYRGAKDVHLVCCRLD